MSKVGRWVLAACLLAPSLATGQDLKQDVLDKVKAATGFIVVEVGRY